MIREKLIVWQTNTESKDGDTMNIAKHIIILALAVLTALPAGAYPLYNADHIHMPRLVPYRTRPQPRGARLPLESVDLRLTGRKDMALPEPEAQDPDLARQILSIIPQDERESYSWAIMDLSDPDRPRYVEHRGLAQQFPGSVGKILVALAFFQALADAYPDDLAARMRLLTETVVTADEFIVKDEHDVPKVSDIGRLYWEPLEIGDTGNLWTYLDWMCSASSNAAASVIMREVLLLQEFGRDYPRPAAESAEALRAPGYKDRLAWMHKTFWNALTRNGLDPNQLRKGSFFTRRGKQLMPGFGSTCNARELMRYLLYLEQGKLVDEWSSREIKRLLYVTQKRIRYASAPALSEAAVYFKSGSLYSCRAEPGFECGKYMGNRVNMLNSVAIVEDPALTRETYYICVLLSNVLRKNSSVQHQTFGTYLHRILQRTGEKE